MLSQEVKHRINTARQILVGKVPDPKAQVEQITTALIYKFMDDMDQQNEMLGGKPQFFVEELKEFSWRRLMSKELSGQERWDLYTRALVAFSKSERVPPLFRTIFKDAYLPYRDAETLNLFLKVINEFTYDHSEELGNAYEYLLSILSSQGDAGQFRNPRHIIDFIVEVVDPKKDNTILDPACGTAGFLISAYKHILRHNSSNFDEKNYIPTFAETLANDAASVEVQKNGGYRGDKLTPDERKRLAGNIVGYDISPDMVRLSLVNMYLHGFATPKIYEYDTLTYEDRWDETFDIILANPPFMTPKGGIRPHKRFQVQANRAEVLFVDYIAEHLTINGKAGIIVPEGIIFQSARAYKNLRKNLVENWGLYAVVSLPPGVFQPYSGVKTSILFIDKALAKKTDEILFVKVENDGFDLGAQRRKIDKNDLPEAYKILKAWQRGEKIKSKLALWVKKEKLAENGEYNLTGDRYRETVDYTKVKWPIVKLGEIAEVSSGNSAPQGKKFFINGKYPFCRTSDVGKVHISDNFKEIADYLNEEGIKGLRLFKKGTILFPKSGASTFLNHRVMLGIDSYVSSHLATIYANSNKILSKFLFYLLCFVDAKSLTNNQNYPSLKLSDIKNIQIPLPPLEVQREIVAEIESYQKIIDGARQVIENWKPKIKIDPEWPKVKLGDVCEVVSGYGFPKQEQGIRNEEIPFLKVSDMNLIGNEMKINNFINSVSRETLKRLKAKSFPSGTVIFPKIGAAISTNKKRILVQEATFDNNIMGLVPDKRKIVSEYLYYLLLDFDLNNWANDSQPPSIRKTTVENHKIYLPPLEIQKQIVAEIEKEQRIIEQLKDLIKVYEQKIKDKISEVWGETN